MKQGASAMGSSDVSAVVLTAVQLSKSFLLSGPLSPLLCNGGLI